jgi:hypothetical protein
LLFFKIINIQFIRINDDVDNINAPGMNIHVLVDNIFVFLHIMNALLLSTEIA